MGIDTRDVAISFFEKRFKRRAVAGDPYFEEWVDRFETGMPYAYMDRESLKVYLKMIEKYHGDISITIRKLKKVL